MPKHLKFQRLTSNADEPRHAVIAHGMLQAAHGATFDEFPRTTDTLAELRRVHAGGEDKSEY